MRQDEMIEILERYRSELEGILARFKRTRDGLYIELKDHGRFRELVLELRDLFNDAFVDGHRHSNPFTAAYNDSVSNFYGSPSYRGVEDVKGCSGLSARSRSAQPSSAEGRDINGAEPE